MVMLLIRGKVELIPVICFLKSISGHLLLVKGEGCISRSIGIIERVGLMVMLLLRGKVG